MLAGFGLVLTPCLGAGTQADGSDPPAAGPGSGPALTLLSGPAVQDGQTPPPPTPGLGGAASTGKDPLPPALPLSPAGGQGRGSSPTSARPGPDGGNKLDAKGGKADAAIQPQEVRFEDNGLVTLHTNELDVRQLLELLSRRGGLNILISPKVSGTITANFEKIALEDLLKSVLKLADLVEKTEGDIRFIYSREELKDDAENKKKERIITKVYRLNYVRADELMVMLTPFLSEDVGRKRFATTPNYQFGVSEASTLATGGSMGTGMGGAVGAGGVGSGAVVSGGAGTIQRGTQPATGGASMSGNDVLVIQDYESNLKIIDQIVARLDIQPVQVLIEAVIISVELDKEQQLGVNFAVVDNLGQQLGVVGAGAALNANTGFTPAQVLTAAGKIASGTPVDPAGFASSTNGIKYGFVSNNITGFIRALETVGSTKVLASPRVLVLNKQRAEIQLGSRLGFRTLSQNFTSTIQQVQFLNVGTLLRLRPFVSSDGMVRLEIHPERSQGAVVDDLPSATTAELTTNVMVPNGATLVIGGLMEDEDDYQSQGLPGLSRWPVVGHLFGFKDKLDKRRELVVLLTPHIWSPESAGQEMAAASARKPQGAAAGASPLSVAAAAPPAAARTSWTRGRRAGTPAGAIGAAGTRDLAITAAGAATPLAGGPKRPDRGAAASPSAPEMELAPAPTPASPSPGNKPGPSPSSMEKAFFSGTMLLRAETIDASKAELKDTLESSDQPQAPAVAAARTGRPSKPPKSDTGVARASIEAREAPRHAGSNIPDLTPVPFTPAATAAAPAPAAPAAARRHVVAAGEDFGSLSERYYGSSNLARPLWWANRSAVAWPGALGAGTRLVIPPRDQLQDVPAARPPARPQPQPQPQSGSAPRPARQATRDAAIQPATYGPVSAGVPAAAPTAAASTPSPAAPEAAEVLPADAGLVIHVVRRRETLRSIAQDRLGDPGRGGEIAALNQDMLAEAGGVNVGMRLLLPADARPLSRAAGGADK